MDAKYAVTPDLAEAQHADSGPPVPADLRPRRSPAQLHQPLRALVAVAEVAAAVALGFAVVWAWRRGLIPYELPTSDNPAMPRSVDRWSGPWIGAAFTLATAAGVLVVDAVRQLTLAARGPWQTAGHGRDDRDDPEE